MADPEAGARRSADGNAPRAPRPGGLTSFSESLSSPTANVRRALLLVAMVFTLACLGFLHAGWSLSDAAYMVTLTIFSVGYGEVHPLNTPWLRALAMFTIVFGCTAMIVLTGALVQLFTHFELRRVFRMDRVQSQIERLAGHVIVCGYGRMGQQLAGELSAAKLPFVIIERSSARALEARAADHLCLEADAADEATLIAAGIRNARALATVLPDDATNVFVTLTARNLSAGLAIISRGELPSTEGKLVYAGADKVVLPTHIGAERIAEMILFPGSERLVDASPALQDLRRGLREYGVAVEVVTVPQKAMLVGAAVSEAEELGRGAFLILQIDRADGKSLPHPGPETRIEAGDRIALLLREAKLGAGAVFERLASQAHAGRGRHRL